MAYLDPNPAAATAITVLTELIKAGRYTPAGFSMADMTKEAVAIKKLIEQLYSDKSA